MANKMSVKGQTWGYKEQKSLLEIWAEENVHKNMVVFKTFRTQRTKQKRLNQSVEQCHVAVKKMHHQYIKICKTQQGSGSSSDIKDKVHIILSTIG